MKKKLFSGIMVIIFILVWQLTGCEPEFVDIIYVPADYLTIQDAIDAAADGYKIVIADGVYTGPRNKNLYWNGSVKHLWIESENGPLGCIIDCEEDGRGFLLDQGQNRSDVIKGLTIINGLAADASSGLVGGGAILCDATSPRIENCILRNNTAGAKEVAAPLKDGGAIECINGSEPFISFNTIESNWANHTGAGIHFDNSNGRVENNVITDNISLGCYGGGGISLVMWSRPEILNNLIAYNHAEYYGDGGYGAGIICMNSNPSIVNNTIVYNSTNTDLSDGEGGGVRIRGMPYPVLVNNILWYNTSSPGFENLDFQYPTATLDIQYCNLEGGLGTVLSTNPATIINNDPDFTDIATRDFSLLVSSPCIDTGIVDTSLYPFSFFDLAHNARISGITIDMGAYEYQF